MKLMIRFADKIVGGLIILAIGVLIFVVFMLGSGQRWFSRDYVFKSYFNSGSGLSINMAVQYKGFTIGNVKSIRLAEDDRVEVQFTIFDTYIDRVKYGSLVEVISSPIGIGGGFMFYPGLGDYLLQEGDTIYAVNSSEGKRFLAQGLASRPDQDDNINIIIQRVGTLLGTLNVVFADIQDALAGSDDTSLGRTLGELEGAVAGVRVLAENLSYDAEYAIYNLLDQIGPILDNVKSLTFELSDPDGTVMTILDSDGEVYSSLAESLAAISGTLRNLEKTTDFIPPQMPQIVVMLNNLHGTLKAAEDVLIALTNNPLLKGGVPVHVETRAGGAHSRDTEF